MLTSFEFETKYINTLVIWCISINQSGVNTMKTISDNYNSYRRFTNMHLNGFHSTPNICLLHSAIKQEDPAPEEQNAEPAPEANSGDPIHAHATVFCENNVYGKQILDDEMTSHIIGPLWGEFINNFCVPFTSNSHKFLVFSLLLVSKSWTITRCHCKDMYHPKTIVFPNSATVMGCQSPSEWLGYKASSYATPWKHQYISTLAKHISRL